MTTLATPLPTVDSQPQPASGRDPHSVYRVTKIVASHADGWEQAAASGVAELAKSISDLRIAQVLEKDVSVHPDGSHTYRVKLAVSYRIDRRRVVAGGRVTTARRFLVLADQAASGEALGRELATRIAAGLSEFHFVLPIQLPNSPMMWGDPTTGFVGFSAADVGAAADEAVQIAQARLDELLQTARSRGADATGEVTTGDPLSAALTVLERGSFDEIVLCTHPHAVARRLHLDLAHRLARHTQLPISHIDA